MSPVGGSCGYFFRSYLGLKRTNGQATLRSDRISLSHAPGATGGLVLSGNRDTGGGPARAPGGDFTTQVGLVSDRTGSARTCASPCAFHHVNHPSEQHWRYYTVHSSSGGVAHCRTLTCSSRHMSTFKRGKLIRSSLLSSARAQRPLHFIFLHHHECGRYIIQLTDLQDGRRQQPGPSILRRHELEQCVGGSWRRWCSGLHGQQELLCWCNCRFRVCWKFRGDGRERHRQREVHYAEPE